VIEFQGWPKTPRLFRDMVVTEKIDGTNAAVIVTDVWDMLDDAERGYGAYHREYLQQWVAPRSKGSKLVEQDDRFYLVGAQSRKRLITPDDDNFGFARWTFDNATSLARVLGPGRHFGEWWGSGIQRGYDLQPAEKRFSLFNVKRYGWLEDEDDRQLRGVPPWLAVVPTLYTGPFNLGVVEGLLAGLMNHGSKAAPGFMRPEGVVVYHAAAGQTFKALIENDDQPKGEAA